MLDRNGTAAPWSARGELYGVERDGRWQAIGFAPHHVDDSTLIAEYRNRIGELVAALDAVERQLHRVGDESSFEVFIGIAAILETVDSPIAGSETVLARLHRLDGTTTQPVWDPGHIAMAMQVLRDVGGVDVAASQPDDPQLVAACRSAVPRAVAVLEGIARATADALARPGQGSAAQWAPIDAAIRVFDAHRADEGAGTATV
jgi:hypothetical protein